MARKRLTQRFPWLLPIRRRQRLFCFYWNMRRDGNRYAARQTTVQLPCKVFESSCPMYNTATGFDMKYQENKVFNLKLAAVWLDGLLIGPGETLSFWNRVRHADRDTPYREALAEVNGTLVTQYGGGLCQISNLLCWLFLHTPLTIVERHGHDKKDFPEPPSDAPLGVDATVAEGWLDFRVRNDTDQTFQLSLAFDDRHIIGRILSDRESGCVWQAANRSLQYVREPDGIYEEVDVVRRAYSRAEDRCISEQVIYHNRCRIAYPLPGDVPICEKGSAS